MTARSAQYPAAGYRIRIPGEVWALALDTMRGYGRLGSKAGRVGSEAIVLLGGIVAGEELLVTGLYRLGHAAQGDRVSVSPSESRWLVRTLRDRDEKLLGQLHSHRSTAQHSLGDDLHATSYHEGFLSIVVPRFGLGVHYLDQCAVLEYRLGRFSELSADEIRRRIMVHSQTADLSPQPRKEGRWIALGQKLRSTAPKLRFRRIT